MKNNNQNKKDFALRSLALGALLSAYFLVLFSHFIQESKFSLLNDTEGKKSVSFVSANDFLSDIHYTLHLPFEGDSPEEQENESDKTLDEDFHNFYSSSIFVLKANETSGKCLFSLLNFAAHNRSKISLFILYHSWKSFLV
jgi:CRISPR/Cas system-associated endonuclease/helicase Cas3